MFFDQPEKFVECFFCAVDVKINKLQRCCTCGIARYCTKACRENHYYRGHRENCEEHCRRIGDSIDEIDYNLIQVADYTAYLDTLPVASEWSDPEKVKVPRTASMIKLYESVGYPSDADEYEVQKLLRALVLYGVDTDENLNSLCGSAGRGWFEKFGQLWYDARISVGCNALFVEDLQDLIADTEHYGATLPKKPRTPVTKQEQRMALRKLTADFLSAAPASRSSLRTELHPKEEDFAGRVKGQNPKLVASTANITFGADDESHILAGTVHMQVSANGKRIALAPSGWGIKVITVGTEPRGVLRASSCKLGVSIVANENYSSCHLGFLPGSDATLFAQVVERRTGAMSLSKYGWNRNGWKITQKQHGGFNFGCCGHQQLVKISQGIRVSTEGNILLCACLFPEKAEIVQYTLYATADTLEPNAERQTKFPVALAESREFFVRVISHLTREEPTKQGVNCLFLRDESPLFFLTDDLWVLFHVPTRRTLNFKNIVGNALPDGYRVQCACVSPAGDIWLGARGPSISCSVIWVKRPDEVAAEQVSEPRTQTTAVRNLRRMEPCGYIESINCDEGNAVFLLIHSAYPYAPRDIYLLNPISERSVIKTAAHDVSVDDTAYCADYSLDCKIALQSAANARLLPDISKLLWHSQLYPNMDNALSAFSSEPEKYANVVAQFFPQLAGSKNWPAHMQLVQTICNYGPHRHHAVLMSPMDMVSGGTPLVVELLARTVAVNVETHGARQLVHPTMLEPLCEFVAGQQQDISSDKRRSAISVVLAILKTSPHGGSTGAILEKLAPVLQARNERNAGNDHGEGVLLGPLRDPQCLNVSDVYNALCWSVMATQVNSNLVQEYGEALLPPFLKAGAHHALAELVGLHVSDKRPADGDRSDAEALINESIQLAFPGNAGFYFEYIGHGTDMLQKREALAAKLQHEHPDRVEGYGLMAGVMMTTQRLQNKVCAKVEADDILKLIADGITMGRSTVPAWDEAMRKAEAGHAAINDEDGFLPWGLHVNRPFLRLLQTKVRVLEAFHRYTEALAVSELLMSFNPGDNQGTRFNMLGSAANCGNLDVLRRLVNAETFSDSVEFHYTKLALAIDDREANDNIVTTLRKALGSSVWPAFFLHYRVASMCDTIATWNKSKNNGSRALGSYEQGYDYVVSAIALWTKRISPASFGICPVHWLFQVEPLFDWQRYIMGDIADAGLTMPGYVPPLDELTRVLGQKRILIRYRQTIRVKPSRKTKGASLSSHLEELAVECTTCVQHIPYDRRNDEMAPADNLESLRVYVSEFVHTTEESSRHEPSFVRKSDAGRRCGWLILRYEHITDCPYFNFFRREDAEVLAEERPLYGNPQNNIDLAELDAEIRQEEERTESVLADKQERERIEKLKGGWLSLKHRVLSSGAGDAMEIESLASELRQLQAHDLVEPFRAELKEAANEFAAEEGESLSAMCTTLQTRLEWLVQEISQKDAAGSASSRRKEFLCPHCGEDLAHKERLKRHKRSCGQRKIYCSEAGCDAFLLACDLQKHLKEECEYAEVDCFLGCGMKVTRHYTKKHAEELCRHREVACERMCCWRGPLSLREAHSFDCPFTKVACQQCYVPVEQGKMREHKCKIATAGDACTLCLTGFEEIVLNGSAPAVPLTEVGTTMQKSCTCASYTCCVRCLVSWKTKLESERMRARFPDRQRSLSCPVCTRPCDSVAPLPRHLVEMTGNVTIPPLPSMTAALGSVHWISPLVIRFTHDTIKGSFKSYVDWSNGRRVEKKEKDILDSMQEVLEKLGEPPLALDCLDVCWHQSQLYLAGTGNRRLCMWRVLALGRPNNFSLIKVRIVDKEAPGIKFAQKCTTGCEGRWICIRNTDVSDGIKKTGVELIKVGLAFEACKASGEPGLQWPQARALLAAYT